jgi:hypothetical protein
VNKNSLDNLRPYGTPTGNPRNQELADPTPAWSIRGSMRRIAATEIDLSDKEAVEKLYTGTATIGKAIAVKAMQKALEGDLGAIKHATDSIDGPQDKEPLDQKQPIVVNIIRFGAKNDDRISVIEGEKHEENRLIPREEQ